MNRIKPKYQLSGILGFFLLFFTSFAVAQEKTLVITHDVSSDPIGKYIYLFKDPQSSFSDSDVVNSADAFESDNTNIPVMNVTNGTIWAKFKVVNFTLDSTFFLNLQYTNISELTIFRYNNHKLDSISFTGSGLPFDKTVNLGPEFVFPVKLLKGDTAQFFIKVRSKHQILLPLFIKTKENLDETTGFENLVFGLYFGIILSILFYNLFLFISTKDLSYLFYTTYLFFLGLAQITLSGYGFKYLWPDFPSINNYALIVTTAIAGITGILFAIFFLRISYHFRSFIFLLSAVLLLFFVSIIGTLSGNNSLSYDMVNYATLFGGILLMIIPTFVMLKGDRAAVFYLIAWTSFFAGIITLVLRNVNILPYTTFTTYASYIGSAIEAILLSIALADRINTLRKEKEVSQAYALKISKENETLIKEQNIVLEQKVAERTDELQTANKQLTRALDDLKDAQIQLVEAEKMASLGQLTAGIAHEINNPINFVKANIRPLRMDINDLLEMIDDYSKLHKIQNGNLSTHLDEIYEKAQSIDLGFVKGEIQQLLKGIEEGAERTAEIVKGLKTFSRLDESELKTANVHDGIESTLVLLRNTMPKYIKAEKKFCAKGDIECLPGKLNQVFMNILNNAIHAISSKKEITEEELITIATSDTDNNEIRISFKDTGIGMTEEVKHRIYEPFFTTKPVGEGTGLGMSIVFKIVEEHNGKIEIISEPEKGAEFIITLPHIHSEL